MSASDLLSIFDQDWHLFPGADQALCKEIGGDLWFPPAGSAGWEARRICGMCPVRKACAEYAIQNYVTDGIWGGLTREGRRRIWKERGMTAPVEEDETTEGCA